MSRKSPDNGDVQEECVPRRRPPHRYPQWEVAALSVGLLVTSAALIASLPSTVIESPVSPELAFVAIAIGFALTEYTVFRFVFRRESIAFSLSEIPLALCLAYLAPGPALGARAIGSLSVILLVRRPPLYKFVFNIGMFVFELALAFVVFRGFIGETGTGDVQVVAAAIIATGIAGVVSSVLVSVRPHTSS